MLFAEIASTSAAVAATSARRTKIALIGDCLRQAQPDEAEAAVAYLAGVLRQRQIGIGWASLRELPAPAAEPTLTVREVDEILAAIGTASGAGSRARRAELLAELFGRSTDQEQRYLRGLLTGEVRQGALAGVAADAIARAAEVPVADVRRALLLRGDLKVVGATALTEGAAGLAEFTLQVGQPLAPMLAQTAPDLAAAYDKVGVAEPSVEWKLDGIRVQVHKSGAEVGVYTRSLDDVTGRLPEIVEAVAAFPMTEAVLDGEAIVLRAQGTPQPFQVTASRTGSRVDVQAMRTDHPVTVFFFDILHADGVDLLDEPAEVRWARLRELVPQQYLVPYVRTSDVAEAQAFFEQTLAAGHEGVVVKSPASSYDAGRRGAAWLKVKPRHTLDLVVLAAEWGHGRRRGWLSNLHLGARGPDGEFVMLGKTFKGLTDEMLTWQTERLLELATEKSDWVVKVRPELVVEVAIDGVQSSRRYPGGMALRLARVLRYREDKTAADIDTVAAVRALATW
ncbi:MAG: ATP-dependent DNA ligase [Streptosporangiales bacterium]|nr:ATP-dependent DNA ligase [Streptosporangiales bacterium]